MNDSPSSTAVSEMRWREAQASEQRYWADMDLAELLRIAAEKPGFLALLGRERQAALFDGAEVLEIGCGPLGLSVASFYADKAAMRRLVKIDPLPRRHLLDTASARLDWALPFVRWLETLAGEGEYRQGAGEALSGVAEFDTVLSYNVLDHVRDPAAILANAYRALRPGGRLLVGVDCLSLAGRLRFEHLTRRLARGSILVEAHPHSFLARHVASLIGRAGFADLEVFGLPGALKRRIGGSHRPAFLARKPRT